MTNLNRTLQEQMKTLKSKLLKLEERKDNFKSEDDENIKDEKPEENVDKDEN